MIKRILSILLIISLVLIQLMTFLSSKAYACSCAFLETKEKLELYSAVFEGTVIEIGETKSLSPYSQVRDYTFEVERGWKGVKDKKVIVTSLDGGSNSCGYQFSKDQTYLVYASLDKDDTLITSLCSNNLLSSEAGEELKQLGAGQHINSNNEEGTPSSIILYSILILILLLIIVAVWRIRTRIRK
ncbi:hypothetical protein QPK24_10830 [Paenibacillus polygoni]|uniref:Tissue inhibitor of metalloproteinase n=1 Tax=Paenibacillus polygoni TaxID=3050112 RepID=A0ABY8X7U4_9BACL|nr:hypothetical protein [Paenibacillus polygoni]WIV21123.1 hypothetical protein QPK24_10830 [Paenibacillus polygoni]